MCGNFTLPYKSQSQNGHLQKLINKGLFFSKETLVNLVEAVVVNNLPFQYRFETDLYPLD